MNLKKRIAASLSGAVLLTSIGFMSAAEASATVYYGTAVCTGGNVVGIYVNQSGNGGWASWSPQSNPTGANWHYNFNSNNYTISVGCGGTPSAWATTNYGPTVNNSWASRDYVCDVGRRVCALA